MRRSKQLVVVLALALAMPVAAHADVMSLLFQAGSPTTATTTSTSVENDLVAWAGEPKLVTLGELLQVAVRQAPTLASARLDIAIAEAQIQETWVKNDWRVQAQVQAQRQEGGLFAGLPLGTSDSFIGNVDVQRTLPTGAIFDLHGNTQYSSSEITIAGNTETSKSWYDTITAGITQPLLKGRGRLIFDANERKARLSRDVAVLAKRLAAIKEVQTVVSAYWDLVLAERQVAITDESLSLTRERLRITQLGADGGKIAKSEIPAVQQIIATREEDVLTGELGVLNASIALRRSVGLPIGKGDLGLRVDAQLDIVDRKFELGALIERAYAASPELAQLDKQGAAATIDIEVTENGLLPQLDLALSAGPSGQDIGASSAAKQMIEFKQYTVGGSLTFSRSIGQNDVRGRAREQRATRDKLKVNAFDVRAQYAQTMSQAVAQVELANRRVLLSERAIQLANQNIQIETDRFNLGRSTNFDVLNRHEDLRQAELRRAQALIDWHKAEIVILALTGDILPTYGITVE